MKVFLSALLVITLLSSAAPPAAHIPKNFDATGADKEAIQDLLKTYTDAVSTKNKALFETLLLNSHIPFSDIGTAVRSTAEQQTRQYEAFKKDVFEGEPFSQQFQDIHIEQDGVLAAVSLVFVNRSAQGASWGWKTLQLLKIDGHWKIASEFYTGHPA